VTMILKDAEARYQRYLNAESAILEGQQVRFGDRLLTRADLQWVQRGLKEAAREIATIKNRGRGYSLAKIV